MSAAPLRSGRARTFNSVSGKPRVRVLIVAPSLDILGGQAIQATRLLEHLRSQSAVDVGFLPHNPRLPGALSVIQAIKYLRTVVTSAVYLISLLREVGRYDVIHIFSASYYSYLLCAMPAILVARLFGRPSILNYRSGEAEDHLAKWRATAVPTMRLTDKIVAPSGYLVEVFRRFGLDAESISNAVDAECFCYRDRSPLRPTFLSGRNLEPLYNVGCTLKAFGIIQGRFPDARLLVAGDGSQRRSLERLASLLSLRNVEFLGAVSPDRMNDLYDAADIYLNSSNIDNMPASILEAFASGLPVVTTNAGGIPYILTHEETGLMVDRGDYEGLAACALRLLHDAELASTLTRNALSECSKYRWAEVCDRWISLYTEMAARRAAATGVNTLMQSERDRIGSIESDTRTSSYGPSSLNREAGASRIRVLIVAPSLEILGGQSIQAAYLYSMLKEVPYLAVGLLPINPSLPGPLNLLQRIKYVRTLATSTFYCYSLVRRLRRYDIAHIFSASYFSFLLSPTPAMLLARAYGKKIVLNYHSGEAEDHLKTWRRTAARTMRIADRIVVPSAYLVDVLQGFSLNAIAVFNTVDAGVFSFRERCPLRPVFLSNRNLEPLYNVSCILRAFSIIQGAYPDARLIVAGHGKERKSLERLAARLHLEHIDFTGRVEPSRMRELYDSADIYLNSSNIDNMPGSILESFASGLPVVTTDAGGIPYILRHEQTGLMVKRGDHEGLAAQALRLLDDPALAKRIVDNARAECEKYRASVVREQWINLYRGLMDGRRAERTPRAFERLESSPISTDRAAGLLYAAEQAGEAGQAGQRGAEITSMEKLQCYR